jgi:hypothetical protein
MTEVVTLYTKQFLTGHIDEDLKPFVDMILENYNSGRNMAKDPDDIRHEDIRIQFTPQVQGIVKRLIAEWDSQFDQQIELCWQNKPGQDPNHSFWAVVHEKNESTNLHTHESGDNYSDGAHVSAALWIQVPPHSGDLVFQYNTNPYLVNQYLVKSEEGKFAMFDSTLPHFVTKNQSNDLRIVISMNFRIVEKELSDATRNK